MLLPASNHRFRSETQIWSGTNQKCHKDFQVEFGNQIAGSFSTHFVNACPHAVHSTVAGVIHPDSQRLGPEYANCQASQAHRKSFLWHGTWFASNSKIRIWDPLIRRGFVLIQRSWMCLGPLFTDLRSYDRVWRLVMHTFVSFQVLCTESLNANIHQISNRNHGKDLLFVLIQRSWMCLSPLCTDSQSYERVRGLVVHTFVSWSWHFLYSLELNCVSKVDLIHQCARAYHEYYKTVEFQLQTPTGSGRTRKSCYSQVPRFANKKTLL